jgi:ubiquinone/menaquinone biosynthesis C-methylase UbiE
MNEENVKQTVREFYDQVGWQTIGETLYQNAQYEDLRPVSQDYLHRCHLRVKRHLVPRGDYFLDAGSGPVQYPEYLTYSEGYQKRVCVDISIVALKEARKRVGEHGFYVVADIAHLPFRSELFDGITSLHTIHHVPMEDKLPTYAGLYRVLKPGRTLVAVDGWTKSPLMEHLRGLMKFMKRIRAWIKHEEHISIGGSIEGDQAMAKSEIKSREGSDSPAGTFVQKLDADWLIEALTGRMDFDIFVWRSVSVAFLRSVIYPDWGGRFWLRVLFWFEERFPRLLGRIGQYPLVLIRKPPLVEKTEKSPSDV